MVLDMGAGAERTLDDLVRVAHRIGEAIESVIEGKPDAVRLALTVLLAEGHVLIEDVPGVGKTSLAEALARSFGLSFARVQFIRKLFRLESVLQRALGLFPVLQRSYVFFGAGRQTHLVFAKAEGF